MCCAGRARQRRALALLKVTREPLPRFTIGRMPVRDIAQHFLKMFKSAYREGLSFSSPNKDSRDLSDEVSHIPNVIDATLRMKEHIASMTYIILCIWIRVS